MFYLIVHTMDPIADSRLFFVTPCLVGGCPFEDMGSKLMTRMQPVVLLYAL